MASDEPGAQAREIARLMAETADLRSQLDEARRDHARRLTDAEARLWNAFDALDHGVALFDPQDRLVRCNARFANPFDGDPDFGPGIAHGTILWKFLERDLVQLDGQSPEGWHAAMMARWQDDAPDDLFVELSDGSALQLIDRRDSAGNMISLVTDVTALKRIEGELRAAQSRAEAANAAKSAFLANMSHEIRTPMNGVVGMADLLAESDLSEEQRLFVSTIKSSGEALLVIINDVLDFSKIEADRLELHPEPFDLERVVHDLVLLMQPAARKKGIDLVVDYDMFLPAHLVGDAGRMRQILTNLLGNAVKFTQEGYVLIRVVGLETGDGEVSVHLTVEDTGIGIPEDAREHVFGTFNQVDDAEHRRIGGTGLGLSISQRLVEMMGGEIWVDSEVGKGSCFGFRVTMPMVPDAPTLRPATPASLRRALVVDDLEVNRQILDKQLRAMGVDTLCCAGGAEALAALSADIDIVLTDHVMPGMDGLTLARSIRASGSGVPILLLSSSFGGLEAEARAAGVQAVLQNPVPRRALLAKLQALAAQADDSPQPPATLPKGGGEPSPRGTVGARRMRVLTAEDNMTNQLVFEKCVRDLDIDLRFAVNGAEAIALFENFRPDLIFMDISMPQIDGRQAAVEIRAREALRGGRVPIVAMTAHSLAEAEEMQLTFGMDGCLTKPMRRHEIIAAIRVWQPDGTGHLDAGVPGAQRA